MKLVGNWNYPTSVRFGAGRIAELGAAVKAAGMSRPLLVTDPRLAEPADGQARARACWPRTAWRPQYSRDVKPNPVAANVEAGLAGAEGRPARRRRSPSAAARRSMPARSSPSWPGRRGRCGTSRTSATGGRAPTPRASCPIVAVPTTAGTGSEVGRAGVITDETTHTKKVIFHPLMMPKITICDPELTVGMPPAITAGTGMDALAHCLEAYCGPSYHPLADGIAVEGMRLVQGQPGARLPATAAIWKRART